MNQNLKKGDRCKWQFTHNLNSRSSIERVKVGVYWGKARHTSKHWRHYGSVQMGWVHFDGNKNQSQVPLEEIQKIIK